MLSSAIFLINTLNDGKSMLVNDLFEDKFDLKEMAAELSDIITARELIGQAKRDPDLNRHKYLEFMKYLRDKHSKRYSTLIHQKASKLAQVKERD